MPTPPQTPSEALQLPASEVLVVSQKCRFPGPIPDLRNHCLWGQGSGISFVSEPRLAQPIALTCIRA